MIYQFMSGPCQGETVEVTEEVTELRYPHPDRPGIKCRYRVHDGDGPIAGMPGAVQMHYVGDIGES